MYEQAIPWAAWAGLLLLAILCLPIWGIQKAVLISIAWSMRLAMLGLLAGGAYLWFRPNEMPSQVLNTLSEFPRVLSILPDPSAQHFGLCLASLFVLAMLPILIIADVTRRVAGQRYERISATNTHVVAVKERDLDRATVVRPEVEVTPLAVPMMRPIDRRAATATITSARSHIPVAPVR